MRALDPARGRQDRAEVDPRDRHPGQPERPDRRARQTPDLATAQAARASPPTSQADEPRSTSRDRRPPASTGRRGPSAGRDRRGSRSATTGPTRSGWVTGDDSKSRAGDRADRRAGGRAGDRGGRSGGAIGGEVRDDSRSDHPFILTDLSHRSTVEVDFIVKQFFDAARPTVRISPGRRPMPICRRPVIDYDSLVDCRPGVAGAGHLVRAPLPDPGPRRGRDAARSRRDPPPQDDRGRRPGRRARGSGRSSAPAGAIAGPCRSRSSSGIDAPLVCNSGALVKDPRGHRTLWRADLGARRPGRGPRRSSGTATSRPSRSPTDRPRSSTSWSPRPRPADRCSTITSTRTATHAEVDPGWIDRPGGRPLSPLRDRDPAGDAGLRAGDPRPGPRPGPDVRPEEPAIRRDDVRGPPARREQVVGPAPPGRSSGASTPPRSAPWGTT